MTQGSFHSAEQQHNIPIRRSLASHVSWTRDNGITDMPQPGDNPNPCEDHCPARTSRHTSATVHPQGSTGYAGLSMGRCTLYVRSDERQRMQSTHYSIKEKRLTSLPSPDLVPRKDDDCTAVEADRNPYKTERSKEK